MIDMKLAEKFQEALAEFLAERYADILEPEYDAEAVGIDVIRAYDPTNIEKGLAVLLTDGSQVHITIKGYTA